MGGHEYASAERQGRSRRPLPEPAVERGLRLLALLFWVAGVATQPACSSSDGNPAGDLPPASRPDASGDAAPEAMAGAQSGEDSADSKDVLADYDAEASVPEDATKDALAEDVLAEEASLGDAAAEDANAEDAAAFLDVDTGDQAVAPDDAAGDSVGEQWSPDAELDAGGESEEASDPGQDSSDADGGDGGTETNSDAGDPDAADAAWVCVPDAKTCTGLATLEVCAPDGLSSTETACPYVCDEGVCTGECTPGSRRCADCTPEQCEASGHWLALAPCANPTPDCFKGECEPSQPPSCAGLAPSCGPQGDDRCCRRFGVPAGSFYRSYDAVTFTDQGYPATVSGFALDAYEVSVGRFRTFVESGAGTQSAPPAVGSGSHPKIPGSGWSSTWNASLAVDTSALKAALACSATFQTWTDAPGPNETRPINCVSWYDAFAFCAWDGGRLPTEAEWNLAAAGGNEQRVRAWSAPPTSTTLSAQHASYWTDPTNQCMGDGVPGCSVNDLLPVGSLPAGAGRWGHSDLMGNVWEWTLDAFKNPYAIIPCVDCAQLSGSSNRVMRGGSFFGNSATVMASNRGAGDPTARLHSVGLRCAHDAVW